MNASPCARMRTTLYQPTRESTAIVIQLGAVKHRHMAADRVCAGRYAVGLHVQHHLGLALRLADVKAYIETIGWCAIFSPAYANTPSSIPMHRAAVSSAPAY
jgi:hypothetical protein